MTAMLDTMQFAFRANMCVDDAGNIDLQLIWQHLDCPETYAVILFADLALHLTPSLIVYRPNFPSCTCRIPLNTDQQLANKKEMTCDARLMSLLTDGRLY